MRKDSRKTNNSNAGFSLIEVLISVTILAIITIPLLNYFSNSMRYSAMMAERQQATILAQEVTEGILAESRLIVKSGTEYTVPFLEDGPEDPDEPDISYACTYADPGFRSDGSGRAIFTRTTDDGYDVVVTVEARDGGAAGNVQNLADYGINARTDVSHVDFTENNQAVFEFTSMNGTYVAAHPGAVARDGSYIRENMTRTLHVDLSIENEDDGSQSYRAQIYYVYSCPGIEGDAAVISTWESAMLVDKKVSRLRCVYLLFDWCEGGDTVVLTDKGGVATKLAAEDQVLGLNIIYQKGDASDPVDAGPKNTYVLTVDRDAFSGNLSIFTNVGESLGAGRTAGRVQGTLSYPLDPLNPSGDNTLIDSLLGDGKPSLLFSICTEVYEAGHVDGDAPLAVIDTTKGE